MALIACPECQKQISDRATACPHCGNPMPAQASRPQVEKNPSSQPADSQKSTASQFPLPHKHSSRYYFFVSVSVLILVVVGVITLIGSLGALFVVDEEAQKKEWIKQSRERRAQLAALEAAKTPEQRAAEEKARGAAAKARAEKEAAEKKVQQAAAARKQQDELAFQKTVIFLTAIKRSLRDPPSVVWESVLANDDASVICVEYRARNGFGGMSRENAVYARGKASTDAAAWNAHCANRTFNDLTYARRAVN